jgi:hypothetical protein
MLEIAEIVPEDGKFLTVASGEVVIGMCTPRDGGEEAEDDDEFEFEP